jgi:hypothetical protein
MVSQKRRSNGHRRPVSRPKQLTADNQTKGAAMDKADFDDYFKVLDKAGDRVRSVLYAFIIINVALLMYGVNFVYPARQFIFDDVSLRHWSA